MGYQSFEGGRHDTSELNPKHRRSKLVQLTRKGDARYRVLNARFLVIASNMVVALSEADIRKTPRSSGS
jgi:hypothetical protein